MTFLHGVEVLEVTSGSRVIQIPSTSVIGLVGVAQYADAGAFPLDTPVLVTQATIAAAIASLTDTLPDATDPGSLVHALNDIFAVVGAVVVVVRVDHNAVAATQMADVVGDAGDFSGVYALRHAQSILGVKPKILIATGWTHQQATVDEALVANPAATALKAVATTLRAIAITDGPNDTDAAALAKATLEADRRIYTVDPWGIQQDTTGPVVRPMSALVAGMIALNDEVNGYWASPSNKSVPVIIGTGRPVEFSLNDPTASSSTLNAGGVATVVNVPAGGFVLWGNRTGSVDPLWDFLSVVRTADIIYDAIQSAFLWAMDKPFSAQLIRDITNTGNQFLRGLKAKGAIIDGKFWLDPDLNTSGALAAGQQFYDFDFEPPPPLERLTITASRNGDYLTEVISAAVKQAQSA